MATVASDLVAVRHRCRGFAPPPWRMRQALTAETAQWLRLESDEIAPVELSAAGPLVCWSSMWPDRPGDQIHLTVERDGEGSGTRLCWTLFCPVDSQPDEARGARLRYRINRVLNGELREFVDTQG